MTAPIICACGHRASRHYAGKCRAALGCECGDTPPIAATDEGAGADPWEACWSAIANAAWPEGGATRAEVLALLLGARP